MKFKDQPNKKNQVQNHVLEDVEFMKEELAKLRERFQTKTKESASLKVKAEESTKDTTLKEDENKINDEDSSESGVSISIRTFSEIDERKTALNTKSRAFVSKEPGSQTKVKSLTISDYKIEETKINSPTKVSESSFQNEDESNILKEYFDYFQNDKFYISSTANFMVKLKAHFKSKSVNESIGFIKTLNNLVNQHLGKITKKVSRPISEEETAFYFLFIRNILSSNDLVRGLVYDFWIKENINSLAEMTESTRLFVDLDKIDEYINQFAEAKPKKEPKIFEPGENPNFELYASIIYSVLTTLSKHRFYHEKGSSTNHNKYFRVIENILKNVYNTKTTSDEQKKLLKSDKNIKYLIARILVKQGIFEVKENKKLLFSEPRVEQAVVDFKSQSQASMYKFIIEDMKALVNCDLRIA